MQDDYRNRFDKRFAYIKNGDIIEEVQAINRMHPDEYMRNGGPYHYIGSFLQWSAGAGLLLLSVDKIDKLHSGPGGLTARVINTKKFANKRTQAKLQLLAFFKILLNLLSFRPDLILCSVAGGLPLAACFFASRILRVPYIHSRHMRIELHEPSFLRRVRMKIESHMIRNASCIICNGPYLRDQLAKIHISKDKIIKYDLPYRDLLSLPDSAQPAIDSSVFVNRCTLLYVGRIEEKKGALDLFNACRNILLRDKSVSLIYIGDGRLMERLKHVSRESGVENSIVLLGQQPHKTVMEIMKKCDVLIVPTRQELGEGRCKSVIEALILGVPVVTPGYGAFRYLVEDGINGLFYQPDDIDDLTTKIEFLILNKQERKRLGANAQKSGQSLMHPNKTFIDALEEAANFKPVRKSRSFFH